MKRRSSEFGAGVVAQAEEDRSFWGRLGWDVLGSAATVLVALGYALYKFFADSFLSR